MQPEDMKQTGFIRGHCGSVANKAPQDRVTGAQRHILHCRRSIFKGLEHVSHPTTLPGKRSRQGRACSGLLRFKETALCQRTKP